MQSDMKVSCKRPRWTVNFIELSSIYNYLTRNDYRVGQSKDEKATNSIKSKVILSRRWTIDAQKTEAAGHARQKKNMETL